MKSRGLRTAATVIVLVFSLGSAGCMGNFVAHTKLAAWNQKATGEKWLNELIFIGLIVVPVYEVVWLADALVFNSVEFWTGKNPMAAASDFQKTVESGDHRVVQSFHQNDEMRSMEVKYFVRGRLESTLTLSKRYGSPEYEGVTVAADGTAEKFTMRPVENGIKLTRVDTQGREIVQVFEGAALQSVSEKVAAALDRRQEKVAAATYVR